jgi:predicted TPR repeat methyltransferase
LWRWSAPGAPHGLRSAAVPPVAAEDGLELLLAEQIAYYWALAAEYEDHALDLPAGEELLSALDAFQPERNVLEIACGTGVWTGRLLRHATTVTSLDAASEMLAIASARIDDERVRFIQADARLATGSPVRRDVPSASGSHTCQPSDLSRSGH